MAQVVERLTGGQEAAGSSPVIPTESLQFDMENEIEWRKRKSRWICTFASFCALTMSHAQTKQMSDDEGLHSIGRQMLCMHTATAATVREQSSRTCRHGSK